LAHNLVKCMLEITKKYNKKILFIFDSCELIFNFEEWFICNFLILLINENPNIVLIFSRQFDTYLQDMSNINKKSLIIREFADKIKTQSPLIIDLKNFSKTDIKIYLENIFKNMFKNKINKINEKIIDFVFKNSCG
ncbi:unnamed protein product, partial [marine sediment metagenome]